MSATAKTGWRLDNMRRVSSREGYQVVARCSECHDYLVIQLPPADRLGQVALCLAEMNHALCQCRRSEWPHPKWRTLSLFVRVGPAEREGSETPDADVRLVVAIDRSGPEPRVQFRGDDAWHDLDHWTTEFLPAAADDDDS